MLKLLPFLLAIFLSIFPLFVETGSTSSPEIPQAVTEEEVRAFLNEYIDAYVKMDFDRFMALFSKDAFENRTYLYDDIYKGYGKQFRVSKGLKCEINIFFIQTYTQSAYVSGRYVMRQKLKGWNPWRVYKGNIQFYLVRENGSLKIKELGYGIYR